MCAHFSRRYCGVEIHGLFTVIFAHESSQTRLCEYSWFLSLTLTVLLFLSAKSIFTSILEDKNIIPTITGRTEA